MKCMICNQIGDTRPTILEGEICQLNNKIKYYPLINSYLCEDCFNDCVSSKNNDLTALLNHIAITKYSRTL